MDLFFVHSVHSGTKGHRLFLVTIVEKVLRTNLHGPVWRLKETPLQVDVETCEMLRRIFYSYCPAFCVTRFVILNRKTKESYFRHELLLLRLLRPFAQIFLVSFLEPLAKFLQFWRKVKPCNAI